MIQPTEYESVSFTSNVLESEVIGENGIKYDVEQFFNSIQPQIQSVRTKLHEKRKYAEKHGESVFDIDAQAVLTDEDIGLIPETTIKVIEDVSDGFWVDYFQQSYREGNATIQDVPEIEKAIWVSADNVSAGQSENTVRITINKNVSIELETEFNILGLIDQIDTVAISFYEEEKMEAMEHITQRESITKVQLDGYSDQSEFTRIYRDLDEPSDTLKSDLITLEVSDHAKQEVFSILNNESYYPIDTQFILELLITDSIEAACIPYYNPELTTMICDVFDINMYHIPQVGLIVLSNTEFNTTLFTTLEQTFPERQSLTPSEETEIANLLEHPQSARYNDGFFIGDMYQKLAQMRQSGALTNDDCFYFSLCQFSVPATEQAIHEAVQYGKHLANQTNNQYSDSTLRELHTKWNTAPI